MAKQKTSHTKYKVNVGDRVMSVLIYVIYAIFAFVCVYPFYYIFINSISNNDISARGKVLFLPKEIHFTNYTRVGQIPGLADSFRISIGRTLIGTALTVVIAAFLGYMFTRDTLWKRKFWFRFVAATMYFNAGTIPWYLNMSMLGLTNNFMAYIIPGIVAPYNIILVKTYIESIPAEMEESAFMDGASYWTIFRKIIWPLCTPILATIAIFGAVGHWNSFTDSLILMQDASNLFTLQHRLYLYLNTSSNIGALMNSGVSSSVGETLMQSALNAKVIKYTISMVSIIPILMVYPLMQRYFVKGIMVGAVKG